MQKFNFSKPKKNKLGKLYREDGSELPAQKAQEIALEKYSFTQDWRSGSSGQRWQNKGGGFKHHLDRMKRFVKIRNTGVLGYFTAPPEGTNQPAEKEIESAANTANLQYYSSDLVRCFHDIIAGGRFMPPSIWIEQLRKRNMDVNNAQKHLTGLVRVIKAIDYQKIPGKTPLEKAVCTLKLLGKIDKEASVEASSFYTSPDRQENALQKLDDAINQAKQLDEAEFLLLGGTLAGDKHNEHLEITVELLESLLTNNQAKFIMKVARLLDKIPKLKIEGEHKVQKDVSGLDVRARPMESLNELPKINKASWSMFLDHPEIFWSKAMNREFMIREHVSRQSQKQLLYLLVDSSGSMDDGNRIQLALAVLLNRLKGVINGEASLQYRFFDTQVFKESHASTPSEAKKALEALRKNNYSGGGTDITHAIKAGVSSITTKQKNEGGVRPHLAIITDGCDDIDLKLGDLNDVVLHAFIVGGQNKELAALSKKSGGIAAILSNDGDVKIL